MVGRLEDAGLVVDEKLDIIIEHLRKHEEHAARLEIRLAKYSESMAEVIVGGVVVVVAFSSGPTACKYIYI